MSSRPVPVSELELPFLDTLGLERQEALAAMDRAREQHWLARTEFGYTVTRLEDVTAVLRDRRFHSAVSAITELQGVGDVEGSEYFERRSESILSMEGEQHAPAAPRRACIHPGIGQSVAPDDACGGRRPGRRRLGPGSVRIRRRRVRALPDPDHL